MATALGLSVVVAVADTWIKLRLSDIAKLLSMMITDVIDRSSSVSPTWWGCLVVG